MAQLFVDTGSFTLEPLPHTCMRGGKQEGLTVGTEQLGGYFILFIAFRCRGQSQVRAERHEQCAGWDGPQGRNPASPSQDTTTHTGKPFKHHSN